MYLLSEHLARAEVAERLRRAEITRVRRRLITEARNRRALEVALRRLERAGDQVESAWRVTSRPALR